MEFIIFSNDYINSKNYITAGVSKICIDIERRGKAERQAKRDTLISKHQIEDIAKISERIGIENTICRINPFHEKTYSEIKQSIKLGAGSIIFPYFKEIDEIKFFIDNVNGKAKTIALVETMQSFLRLPNIVNIPGLDQIHIGLNDLSLDIGFENMFEIVELGWMEFLQEKIFKNKIKFGFGGVSTLNDVDCTFPAKRVLNHHVKSNSSAVILSRRFLNNCGQNSNSNNDFWSTLENEINLLNKFLEGKK
tara:strand:- start:3175 stop:3924 length:750 start_codon:yes stop_codon:yes gene_type:complete